MDRFLHSSLGHPLLRYWSANSPSLKSSDFMYPIFVEPDAIPPRSAVLSSAVEVAPPNEEDATREILDHTVPIDLPPVSTCESTVKSGQNGVSGGKGIPGVSKIPLSTLVATLQGLVLKGLKSVLLFASIPDQLKTPDAAVADTPGNPVLEAISLISLHYPDLLIACDLCLCNFTDHGHCGIIKPAHLVAATRSNDYGGPSTPAHEYPLGRDFIDNAASVARLVKIGLAYSRAGAHILAPSDMMDGRIGALKAALVEHGLQSRSAIMSYSAKFASAFYGPFRDMVGCKIRGTGTIQDGGGGDGMGNAKKRMRRGGRCPISNDRSQYQLPVGSSALAIRALGRDAREGADILMVKPATAYLDIVRSAKNTFPTHPIAVYQTSGEYAMLYHAAASGCVDLNAALVESILCMKRAGADLVITYFAPLLLDIVAAAAAAGTQPPQQPLSMTSPSPSVLSGDLERLDDDSAFSDPGSDDLSRRSGPLRGAHLNEMLFL